MTATAPTVPTPTIVPPTNAVQPAGCPVVEFLHSADPSRPLVEVHVPLQLPAGDCHQLRKDLTAASQVQIVLQDLYAKAEKDPALVEAVKKATTLRQRATAAAADVAIAEAQHATMTANYRLQLQDGDPGHEADAELDHQALIVARLRVKAKDLAGFAVAAEEAVHPIRRDARQAVADSVRGGYVAELERHTLPIVRTLAEHVVQATAASVALNLLDLHFRHQRGR